MSSELPRPPKKLFTKKNPEIPDLPRLEGREPATVPKDYFDSWPHKEIPESGIFTQVNVKVFEDFTKISPQPAKSRLQKVLRDLKYGADFLNVFSGLNTMTLKSHVKKDNFFTNPPGFRLLVSAQF